MAGDGGRVPDVSEQRAEVDDTGIAEILGLVDEMGAALMTTWAHTDDHWYWNRARQLREKAAALAATFSDPASVLAALLAESPEATVAALEALLGERADMRPFPMQDGPPIPWCVAEAIHMHLYRYSQSLEDVGRRGGFGWPEVGHLWNPPHSNHAQRVACRDAVCRSLLSKAPKEDR